MLAGFSTSASIQAIGHKACCDLTEEFLHPLLIGRLEIESDHNILVCPVCIWLRWHKRKVKAPQNSELGLKVRLFRDASITWLYRNQMDSLTQITPVSEHMEGNGNVSKLS